MHFTSNCIDRKCVFCCERKSIVVLPKDTKTTRTNDQHKVWPVTYNKPPCYSLLVWLSLSSLAPPPHFCKFIHSKDIFLLVKIFYKSSPPPSTHTHTHFQFASDATVYCFENTCFEYLQKELTKFFCLRSGKIDSPILFVDSPVLGIVYDDWGKLVN